MLSILLSRSGILELKIGCQFVRLARPFRASFPGSVECTNATYAWSGILLYTVGSLVFSNSFFGKCIRSA